MSNLIVDVLFNRGLIKDITNNINFNLSDTFYTGFDPTAKSLHIGNLLVIINLIRLYKMGYTPLVVIGGATSLIGDPSDKIFSRDILKKKHVISNTEFIFNQLNNLFQKNNCEVQILNNLDWFKNIDVIYFFSKISRYFSINYMLSKDFIKNRFINTSNGLKGVVFNEFSYQLFQAYDFLFLYKNYNCKLQIGGSDQWGNILSGIDLVKKKLNKIVYGLTFPLITNNKGDKLGKTNYKSNTIWLDKNMTSVYIFYQYWINLSDEYIKKIFKFYSFMVIDDINQLIYQHNKNPANKLLQKLLSKELTCLIHGNEEYYRVRKCSLILHNKKYHILQCINSVDKFLYLFNGVPKSLFKKQEDYSFLNENCNIVYFLVKIIKFIASNSEAKRLVKNKSISLNNNPILDIKYIVTYNNIIYNNYIIINKGKRDVHIIYVL